VEKKNLIEREDQMTSKEVCRRMHARRGGERDSTKIDKLQKKKRGGGGREGGKRIRNLGLLPLEGTAGE